MHVEHSVTGLCAAVRGNSDFISLCMPSDLSTLDTETIIEDRAFPELLSVSVWGSRSGGDGAVGV